MFNKILLERPINILWHSGFGRFSENSIESNIYEYDDFIDSIYVLLPSEFYKNK